MAKVKMTELLNKDCILDISQGLLNLGIADDLVQKKKMNQHAVIFQNAQLWIGD